MTTDPGMDDGAAKRPVPYGTDEISLADYVAILKKVWWKAVLLSLAVGVGVFFWMWRKPPVYQAKAVITPAVDTARTTPSLGALAMLGISVGGPSSTGDLETLFNSEELTVRVFRKHNLWPVLVKDRIDPVTGRWKVDWFDRIFAGNREPRFPGDWDAIRMAKGFLKVSVKKGDTLFLSVVSPSAQGSADILKHYLDEAKSRLQEEALDRAIKNNRFVAEQIGKTVDTLTRERLYALYGQEVEREMMARNREQFGFRIIDPPRVPDIEFGPAIWKIAVAATILSLFLSSFVLFLLSLRKGK